MPGQPPARTARGLPLAALGALALLAGCHAGAGGQFVEVRTAEAFDRHIARRERPVLVEFYRNGCIACMMASGPLTEVSEEYAGRADFVKVEREGTQTMRFRYGIGAYPTVLLFLDGRPRASWVQQNNPAHYREALDAALAELAARRAPPAP